MTIGGWNEWANHVLRKIEEHDKKIWWIVATMISTAITALLGVITTLVIWGITK